jgi:hypothetical protein
VRTTEDVDVLVEADALARVGPVLSAHGFERVGSSRLRHAASGVRVDLLVAGAPLPRDGAGVYPAPADVASSPRDPRIVDLPALLELKLRSRRHRDISDVVELLKRVDDARYLHVEASVDRPLRPELAALRRDALEEMARGD